MVAPFDGVLAGMVAAGLGIEAICLFLSLTRDLLGDSLARLGLRSPHDRPLRKAGTRGWTVLDTMRLIAWRVAGIHPETIGARLGRSSNAVRAKARRLGIPAPPRKALHKVDPATLADPQGYGSPVILPCATGSNAPSVVPVGVPPVASPAVSTPTASVGSALRVVPVADVVVGVAAVASDAARQRELRLLRSVLARSPVSATTAPLLPIDQPTTAPAPGLRSRMRLAHAELVIPSDPLADISWIAAVSKVDSHEIAVRALSMRYFGGQHWKATAADANISPGSLRSIQNRMQLPRDLNRRKFGPTWDRECAQLTLERSEYVLQRATSDADVEVTRRPLFWRRRREIVRFTRAVRFERGLLGDYDKYQSQLINLVTRADLDEPRLALDLDGRGWSGAASLPARAPFAECHGTMRP